LKFVSKKTFNASPAELWQIVHEPGNMPAWNPKCVESVVSGKGEGARFTAVFDMSGKRIEVQGTIVEYVEEERIRFQYQYEEGGKAGRIGELYAISRKGPRQSHLRHEADFSDSTLPFWAKVLIGIVGRFGTKMRNSPLDGIEELLHGGKG